MGLSVCTTGFWRSTRTSGPFVPRPSCRWGASTNASACPGARDAYSRIVEEFPDQAEQAREALTRLGELPGARESIPSRADSQDPTHTLLLDKAPANQAGFSRLFDLSPDGRKMVLSSKNYGPPGIYVVDQPGHRPRLIREQSRGRFNGMPRWSPDGSMIAILVKADGENGALILDLDGNLITQVWFSVGAADLAWNPDQQGLIYSPRSKEISGVRSITLDGQETILTETPGSYVKNLAGYSPDGQWIVGKWITGPQGSGLMVLPAAGGTPRLISGVGEGDKPVFGADGWVYWISSRTRDDNVWRCKIDLEAGEAVGEPEQVTFFRDANVIAVTAARDADTIAYNLQRARSTVWVAPAAQRDAARGLVRGGDPVISPDGSQVFYFGHGPGNEGIFSVPTSGGTPRRLTPESHIVARTSWKQLWPDGSRVAYHAWVGEPPSRERAYFQIPVTGGEPVRLPVPGDAYQWPDLSPDGSSLAYGDESGVYVVPVAGGEPTLLAELANLDQVKWSPDGQYLMVNQYVDANDHYRVYVVPSKGGEPRLLVTEDCYWTGPRVSWHPDGQRLSYVKNGKIWIAYLDGRPPTPFHDESALEAWGGQWAPDGETFYSSGFNDEGPATYRRNTDGTSELFASGWAPTFSGDGRTLLWSSPVISNEMWMMEGLR